MTDLTIEDLVNKVVAEVLKELARRGIHADPAPLRAGSQGQSASSTETVRKIDMTGFRSPVLLERHLEALKPDIKEIVVPAGTVITPGAREILRRKNLTLKYTSTTN